MITTIQQNYQNKYQQKNPAFCAKLVITAGGKDGIKRVFRYVHSQRMAEGNNVGRYWNPKTKQMNFAKMFKELKKGFLKRMERLKGTIVLDKVFDKHHATNHRIFTLKHLDENGNIIMENSNFNIMPVLTPAEAQKVQFEPIVDYLKYMNEQKKLGR